MISVASRVRFALKDGTPGFGEVLSHTSDHAMVAVDPDAGSPFSHEVRPVIWCALSVLTPEVAAELRPEPHDGVGD